MRARWREVRARSRCPINASNARLATIIVRCSGPRDRIKNGRRTASRRALSGAALVTLGARPRHGEVIAALHVLVAMVGKLQRGEDIEHHDRQQHFGVAEIGCEVDRDAQDHEHDGGDGVE